MVGEVKGMVIQVNHQHEWIEAKETIEAVYPLKKNAAGTKEIRVSQKVGNYHSNIYLNLRNHNKIKSCR